MNVFRHAKNYCLSILPITVTRPVVWLDLLLPGVGLLFVVLFRHSIRNVVHSQKGDKSVAPNKEENILPGFAPPPTPT